MNKREMQEHQEREAQRAEWVPRLPVVTDDQLRRVLIGLQPPSLDGLPMWLAQEEVDRRNGGAR